MEPPGWITAFIPAFFANSTQSGNGKNASEDITAPLKSNPKEFALSIACVNASTREVWPVPQEINWLFFAKTIVFDFTCFTNLLAKSKSLINFQSVHQIIEYINVIRDNGFNEYVMVYYDLIAYFMDGKIITEGLGNSLKYFEANIGLQKDKYPVATCVKVMVTS